MDLELLLLVALAAAMYVIADRIVRLIEKRVGQGFRHRPLLFLVVFLVLLLIGLKLIGFPRI